LFSDTFIFGRAPVVWRRAWVVALQIPHHIRAFKIREWVIRFSSVHFFFIFFFNCVFLHFVSFHSILFHFEFIYFMIILVVYFVQPFHLAGPAGGGLERDPFEPAPGVLATAPRVRSSQQ
jgi:hypothetical protein